MKYIQCAENVLLDGYVDYRAPNAWSGPIRFLANHTFVTHHEIGAWMLDTSQDGQSAELSLLWDNRPQTMLRFDLASAALRMAYGEWISALPLVMFRRSSPF